MKLRKGVLGIVFRTGGGEPEFLLLHRKLHWKGWEFPKGGIDEGERPEDALLRELDEETGIAGLELVGAVPYVVSYDYPGDFRKQFNFRGAEQQVFLVRYRHGEVVLSDEHDDFRWVTFQEAMQLLRYDTQKRALENALEMLGKRT